MKAIDLFQMASGNLVRRKLRTFLTVLGIVIGSISIILMVALGLGLQDSINNEFAGFTGINIIEVYKGNNVTQKSRLSEAVSYERLDDLDLDFFQGIEGVDFASPSVRTSAKIVSGQYEAVVPIIGVDATMMEALGFSLESGRLLNNSDISSAVFGQDAIDSFAKAYVNTNQYLRVVEDEEETNTNDYGGGMFGLTADYKDFNVDILADRMQLTMDTAYSVQSDNTLTTSKVYPLNGVGLLKAGDAMRDSNVYMSIDFVTDMIDDEYQSYGIDLRSGYDSAYVKVSNLEDVNRISDYIESKGYQTFAIASILDTIEKTLQVIQVALGAIGGISLLVAAIGITNTMVMAITERKKEIGVMKVIGATIKDIKRLFLIEAALIGFLGGSIGVLISWGISAFISSPFFNQMLSGGDSSGGGAAFSFTLPLWLILFGLGFTTAVGIISGYMPARKAMRSSALEAIRNE